VSSTTKWLVFALSLSVILNVFFLGIWAGRTLVHREPRGPHAFDVAMDASTPMRRVWRNHEASLRPKGEAVRAARRAVRDALVAEPFDAAALESALARLRTETNGAQVALHAALVEAARELGPEERRHLAESRALLRGLSPGPRNP